MGSASEGETIPAAALPGKAFAEHHYTAEELAGLWGLSADKVRRLFEREPGVLVIESDSPMRRKRSRYRTLRIPESVAERVHRRLSVVKGERFPLTGQQK